MAQTTSFNVGPRKGDSVYGDGFDSWVGREDELRELMIATHAKNIAALRKATPFLPWEDAEKILTRDRVKLLTAIMDNAGHLPLDMEKIRQVLGMNAINNAKAVVNGCLRAGFISECRNFEGKQVLNLTELGRDMLDYYEDDPVAFQHVVFG